MPYKDKEVARQKSKERYLNNKHLWKNEDGSWKKANVSIEKRRESARNYYNKNRDTIKLKNQEKRLSSQVFGMCPICKHDKRLVWDHDHTRNEFRDYICHNCNLLIGHSFEDINTLEAAIEYLRKHRR